MRYKSLLKSAGMRFVANYVTKLGLREYEKLLMEAKKRGYQIISLGEFYNKISAAGQMRDKCFLNRHDIDIDLKTARKMFQIEKKMDITSTFYFRLSTLDISFMQEVKNYGSEVGYHFEEIASFAKEHKLKNKDELKSSLSEIRKLFLKNLNMIEASVGFKICSVASHGDFVNRSLGYATTEIIDETLKRKAGIEFEAYELLSYFDKYLSDAPYPEFWRRGSPFAAMKEGTWVICLLTHPSHWERNFWANTKANFKRVTEEIAWKYV